MGDAERIILGGATGEIDRETFTDWVEDHVIPIRP